MSARTACATHPDHDLAVLQRMGAARTVLAGLAAWRGAATDPRARRRLALEAIERVRRGRGGRRQRPPPRSASAVYAKAPAGAAPLAAMAAEAARWADEAIAARDPVHVRDRLGMKGCKHFAEYLDLQRLAAELGDGAARARALRAVERAAAAEAYHAFLGQREASARWREDSMSYPRALYLSGELGAPGPLLAAWRARARRPCQPFWRHVAGRGVDQRLNFAKLFRGLGLAAEADLVAFERAALAPRAPPSRGAGSRGSSSPRTGPTTYAGARADARRRAPFPGAGDPAAALAADAPLSDPHCAPHGRGAAQGARAPRRAGRRVRAGGEPGPARRARRRRRARRALRHQAADYVASRRNADGSFGETHDAARVRAAKGIPAYDVEVGGTLHTTFVCLWALAQRPGGGVDVSRPA